MRMRCLLIRLFAGVVCAAVFAPVAAASAATQPVQIRYIFFDSPGKDTRSTKSLNAEYVLIKNVSKSKRSLTGYTLRDKQGHAYTFATFTLSAGKSVKVHTGRGKNGPTNRYWGMRSYV